MMEMKKLKSKQLCIEMEEKRKQIKAQIKWFIYLLIIAGTFN